MNELLKAFRDDPDSRELAGKIADRLNPLVKFAVIAAGGSEEDFDELSSDILVDILKLIRARRLANDAVVTRALQTASRYRLLNLWRKRDRERAKRDEFGEWERLEGGRASSPFDRASAREMLDRLSSRLPEDAQVLIREFFVEGASYAEIAARRGVPQGTARVLVHRAVKRARGLR